MLERPEGMSETIGELHDRLPAGVWVNLPEYGVRVKRWPTDAEMTADGLGDQTFAEIADTKRLEDA